MTTRNAQTARSGFKAETMLIENENILAMFESYFNKKIDKIYKQKHGKKSDLLILFKDGTLEMLQNKNGTGGGRGHSFDRRSVNKLTDDPEAITLTRNVCLEKSGSRPTVLKSTSNAIILTTLLGDEPRTRPTYFTHTMSDKAGNITELYICSMEKMLEYLLQASYDTMLPKRTCVWLSDEIQLQRKGGTKGEAKPGDIQAKLKLTPGLKAIFTKLM